MTEKNIHENHRERIRNRYIKLGTDGMETHEVLEMMLYYVIPRADTNPIAHRLINTFGSFSAVLDASVEDLAAVEGVGKRAAILLKLFPDVNRVYLDDKKKNVKIIKTVSELGECFAPMFYGRRDEVVAMMCLAANNEVLCVKLLGRGNVNATSFSIREMVAIALRLNASSIVLAHNHPNGIALPSNTDLKTTANIYFLLKSIGIFFMDHLIFASDDFVSLSQSQLMTPGVMNNIEEFLSIRQAQGMEYYEESDASDGRDLNFESFSPSSENGLDFFGDRPLD